MRQWIFDAKKWQEVFTCKPYEYLNLVAQMKTPWFDRNNNVWVDKAEFELTNKQKTTDVDDEIKAAKQAVAEVSAAPKQEQSFAASLEINDDDMPF